MSRSKLIGGVLLIVGTSIGGGMLALPVSTATSSLSYSVGLLAFCWLVMTLGAFLILEVNLRLPPGSNMISMAKTTLGLPGEIIAWTSYLMLLYSLLGAYISGGADVFAHLLSKIHIHIAPSLSAMLFTFIFGGVVYQGIRSVDYVNRVLMFGKLGTYLLLVVIISPHIDFSHFKRHSLGGDTNNIMVLITSFGFATIIPSMRKYFSDDLRAIRKVIWMGSLIPLFCYLIWIAVIMGVVPQEGEHSLIELTHSQQVTTGLTEAINLAVHNSWITGFFAFFSSICMITAFLGVSLGLFDFILDGLRMTPINQSNHTTQQKIKTILLTFGPPLAIVAFSPTIYLQALNYAGVCCVILLLLLPSCMAWKARVTNKGTQEPIVPGGNPALLVVLVTGVLLLMVAWK